MAIDQNNVNLPLQGITVGLQAISVGTSVALFAFSLVHDGFSTDLLGKTVIWTPCWWLLLIGWGALLDGVIAWLANPAIVAAWIMIWFPQRRWLATVFAFSALCCTLSFMLHDDILANEGGGRSAIIGYGTGYRLWMASVATMALWCGTLLVWNRMANRLYKCS
jgi:hypothetical protein